MKTSITFLSFLLLHLQSNAQKLSNQVTNIDTEVDSKTEHEQKNRNFAHSLAKETEKVKKINLYNK